MGKLDVPCAVVSAALDQFAKIRYIALNNETCSMQIAKPSLILLSEDLAVFNA